MKSSRKKQPKKTAVAKPVRVAVSVHEPGGRHLAKAATVVLARERQTITLKRAAGRALYLGEAEPGAYTLSVTAAGLAPARRELNVPGEGKTASVYLGLRGWPAYRYGENVVPFEPHDDLLAIAFESRKPSARSAREHVADLTKKFPLAPLDLNPRSELPFAAAEGAIWLFKLTKPSTEELRAAISRAVNELFGGRARAGMPVDLEPGQVKVIDSRFVIRFRDHLKPADIETLAKRAGGRILRGFIQAGNARLIEFMEGTYRDHLKIVDEWFAQQLLVYGEPDLIAEITDDVFPADPPNDPTFANQTNLTLQNADNAWQYLNGVDANLTLGNPAIYVATFDRGVDTDHPDITGNLSDGTPRLAQCYDFDGLQPCTVPGYTPDTSHGMGVFGIIAAVTNNNNDMAGIASNVHQLGLERPPTFITSVYPDCLLWAAGFDTNNGSPGWPAEPISPAADIISCSHGQNNLALSGLMDDTLRHLTVYGRGGKGTVVIYSAGNDGLVITGVRVFAAHPRTLAISNSDQPDGMGVERLHTGVQPSNIGPEIDICAQGDGARSLNHLGGEQIFGGTSAAAPTVAAAAALMLSVEPNLTWINVRDILRETAVQIDPANADPQGMWVGGFSWWYGFGRLDINAAVQAADDFDPGSVNLVLRDNLADTGVTVPTGGTFWRSPDLWVSQTDPGGVPLPAYGSNPPHENARSGQDNWVRVRVKNVGSAASSDYFVRAYLTHFAGSQFQYPTDYIPSINSGDPIPNPLVQGTYLIGEQQGTGLAAGDVEGFDFLWQAALVPPEEVAGVDWHPCLLAEVSPHTPPAPSGNLPYDNKNICQRNIDIDYSDDDFREMAGVIGHKDDDARIRRIKVCSMSLPKKARVWVRFLDRRVEEAVTKQLKRQAAGEPPPGAPSCGCHKPSHGQKGSGGHAIPGVPTQRLAVLDQLNEHRIFRLAAGGCMTLDVPMIAGPLTAVVLGCHIPKGTRKRPYEVVLIEQSLDGRSLGAFALQADVK
ncbi:MAG TPA: S8 family serine peptidase [Chthoniobacterales bacterium]|nr:S8 family serine peptidase [Chthoniobacterales bacterium]